MKKVAVIGSGFSGMSAAAHLASKGYKVHVFEKNNQPGGRARQFESDGFLFDMGPSWYWMPDVFEQFYQHFGHTTADFYELKRLDPSYRVFWQDQSYWDLPASRKELRAFFEKQEKGAGKKLDLFLEEAAYKYEVGMKEFVYKPSLSVREFMDLRLLKQAIRMDLFQSMSKHVSRFFSHPKLRELMHFPVLFLGATPEKTPALYSMMNYADMALGTWYPKGGMHEIAKAFEKICIGEGVDFHYGAEVERIDIRNDKADYLQVNGKRIYVDIVLATADYHHVEQKLLPPAKRNYSEAYWNRKTFAPSCLLYFLGVDKKVEGLQHHNLFFDADFSQHAHQIYRDVDWPDDPLFYICCPSKTDERVAPAGKENLFILIPVGTGMDDTPEIQKKYLDQVLQRLETHTGQDIRDDIIFSRSYAHRNFKQDYHAYGGNAYGLANTLTQTAFLKPKMKNRHVSNIYYAGQLTVPGPGVPPSIVSGEVAAKLIQKEHKAILHESIV